MRCRKNIEDIWKKLFIYLFIYFMNLWMFSEKKTIVGQNSVQDLNLKKEIQIVWNISKQLQ